MTPSHRRLDDLLEELLPADGLGPGRGELICMVRRERRRRRRRRAVAFALPLLLLPTLLWLTPARSPTRSDFPDGRSLLGLQSTTSDSGTPTRNDPPDSPPRREPHGIRLVDDGELLSMLEGTPAALMEWPDGRRTILVLGPGRSSRP